MNLNEHMKCPDCGSELDGNSACSNCGLERKSCEQDIEIEYKEFPKSEFLEIRKKVKSEAEHAAMPSEKGHKKKKNPPKDISFQSGTGQQSCSMIQTTRKPEQDREEKALLIFFVGLLSAGILAGVYYLFKLYF